MKKILVLLLPLLAFVYLINVVPAFASTSLDLNDRTSNGNNLTSSSEPFVDDANLLAYYKLENTSDSKGSNTLTNNNSASFGTAKFNNGADTGSTNTNKYLTRNSNFGIAGNGSFTISVWVKMNTEISSGLQDFWELNSTTGADRYAMAYYEYNGGTRRIVFDTAGGAIATYNIALGTSVYHHLVFTRNIGRNESKLYVDGVLQATGTIGTGTTYMASNSFGLLASALGVNPMSATMDDVAVFNRVLNPDEVGAIYNANVELGSASNTLAVDSTFENDANLVAYYALEDSSDSKGSNTLTNNNSASFGTAKFNNGADTGSTNTNKYLTRNSNFGIAGNADVSISMWVKMNTEISSGLQDFWELNSTLGADRYFFAYYDYNGGTRRIVFDSAGGTTATCNIALGTSVFHHLVFTRNISANQSKLYVDGTLCATGTNGTGTTYMASNSFGLLASALGVNPMSAKMDDVAVFNRVLSADEVSQIYDSASEIGLTSDTAFSGSQYALDLAAPKSNYLSASDSTSLSLNGDFTLEAWAKFKSLPTSGNSMAILSKWASGNYSYRLSLYNDSGTYKLQADISKNGGNTASDIDTVRWNWTPALNMWNHIALTNTIANSASSEFEFFLNGSSQGNGSVINDSSVGSIYDGSAALDIGRSDSNSYLDGKIDDVRIWDDVRTGTDINNNKDNELTGSETNLVAYYPMETLQVAINAGGSDEGNFLLDQNYSGGTTYTSTNSVNTSGVTNPAPQVVYQTVRYGNFTYTIPNLDPNSSYTVRLHFNELYWNTSYSSFMGGIGSRVFNVSINGSQVLNNFDVYQTAGGPNKAIVEEFPVTSDGSGNITVQFSTVVDNAMVSGIEVIN